jgi:hypothetical protein
LDLRYALGRRPGNTKIQVRNSFPYSGEVQKYELMEARGAVLNDDGKNVTA